MKTSSCQQGGRMQRQSRLSCIQDEQFTPAEPQKGHLLRHGQVRKVGNIPHPLDGTEEQPGRQLTYIVDAHDGAVAS